MSKESGMSEIIKVTDEVQVNELTLVDVPPSNQAEKRCLTVHLDCRLGESWSVYASSNRVSSYAPYPRETRQSLQVRSDASAMRFSHRR